MVKFADVATEKIPTGIKDNNYANYSKVAREGILVGLRRYRFFGTPFMPQYGEFGMSNFKEFLLC